MTTINKKKKKALVGRLNELINGCSEERTTECINRVKYELGRIQDDYYERYYQELVKEANDPEYDEYHTAATLFTYNDPFAIAFYDVIWRDAMFSKDAECILTIFEKIYADEFIDDDTRRERVKEFYRKRTTERGNRNEI